MPSKLDIYNLEARAQNDLIQTITSKPFHEAITINHDRNGAVIDKAVRKLFADEDMKAKFEKFYFVFTPMSPVRIEREYKLLKDNKRDPFNKNELKEMIYTFAVIVLFLIVREQNEFYKNFIERMGNKVENVSAKLPGFLKDANKIYAPVLATIEETPNNSTPEIKCFVELEEQIYKMT